MAEKLTKDERWFLQRHSYVGTSDMPAAERRRKRIEIAKDLAWAEGEAERRGWRAEWEDDAEAWADLQSDVRRGHRSEEDRPKEILTLLLRDEGGHVLQSLGGIEDPTREYGRLIEAELASEALHDLGEKPPEEKPRPKPRAKKKKVS